MEETKTENIKNKKKPKNRLILVLIFILIVALYLVVKIRGEYLNILELGQKYVDIFNQNLTSNIEIFVANFIFVFLAIFITNKFIKKGLKVFFEEDKIPMPKLPNKSIALIMGVVSSIIILPIFSEQFLLISNATWFGMSDPIFGADIGYYFFQKPFIELTLLYILILTIVITIYIAVYYIVAFNVYFNGINIQTLKKNTFIKQLTFNAMVIAIIIAIFAFLNSQNILFEKFLNLDIGSEFAIYGAGLTDVTIKLWGYRILSVLIIVAVAVALYLFRKGKNKKAVVALSIIPIYLVLLFVIMTGFQNIFVNQNELDREKAFIAYNIQNTKNAYNINIEETELENTGTISIEQVNKNEELLSNIPVITKDITLKALDEYQTGTGYYSYRDANLVNYANKLMYLSPREMLSDSKRTYNSKTYEYTHGYGVILSEATKTDEDGNIEYIQKSFDGTDEIIKITEPRIYFGLSTNSNIIINTKNKKEFDYPITSSTNTENVYEGNAGLKLNFIDRLILGIKNKDLNLAFNGNITENTKIITSRNIIQRAKTIMPYLIYDENPYMVIRDDGSLVWVLDAYTISNSYPYSQESTIEVNGAKTKINYIRNSVKVIIDAYNGTMNFYLIDRSDPIAMAYQKIYKDLFMPQNEEIPQDIAKHIVYPKFLYDIQAKILTRYHNVQTEVLYRNDDTWSIAKTSTKRNTSSKNQNLGTAIDSYYIMTNSNELGLIIPYTMNNKQNINAYLIGKYNGQNELKLYKYKADDNVVGIMQLETQIEQDELISAELKSINPAGSKLIKNIIVIPVESTLLYVEPVFQVLLNDDSQVPILKKVIVASGNKLAIGDTLQNAMEKLLSQHAVELDVQNTDNQEGLIEAIIKANKNLEESSSNKDWELMGKDITKLQSLIKELEKITQIKNETEQNTIDSNLVDINNIYSNTISVNE